MNAKKAAAEKAVEWIKNGMTVGLGTGSTAYWAIKKLGEKVNKGLRIKAVASSVTSESLAKEEGIDMVSLSEINRIDVTIDGADEVDQNFNLVKGGGGALLREKILAAASRHFIVIIDETKRVKALGTFALPVEVVPFGYPFTLKALSALGGNPVIRKKEEAHFITDNGNLIADCAFGEIIDVKKLQLSISVIPGVVEHGLFEQTLVHTLITGYTNGRVDVKDLR